MLIGLICKMFSEMWTASAYMAHIPRQAKEFLVKKSFSLPLSVSVSLSKLTFFGELLNSR